MNLIERMRDELAGRFSGRRFEIDAPLKETGEWILDVRDEDGSLYMVVQWRPAQGFGVSVLIPDEMDYGLGPDEVYTDPKQATERVIHLIESGDPTNRPEAVRLAELRQSRGLTQGQVAEKAGVKQANIARIEGRDDVKVSTLIKVVAAMGATLSIRARFPDGTERELEF
jgi:DNA-binding XRE family transcriptional regulator